MTTPHAVRCREPGPLDLLDTAFRTLMACPEPPALDGAAVGHGLPARLIRLDELKAMLLHPSTSYPARDAAWTVLVSAARDDGGRWLLGAAGVALPGLRRVAGRLARDYPAAEQAEVDAELLAGFFTALSTVELSRGHVPGRLCWAAYRAGRDCCRRELTEARHRGGCVESVPPARPYGHPDLVLLAAVDAGVLTLGEARLIGATRLDRVDLRNLSERLGVPYERVRKWRARAERRLVDFVTTGETRVSHLRPKPGLDGCGGFRGRPGYPGGPSGAPTALTPPEPGR